MKKIFYSVFASALLLAGGCAKEVVNPEHENNEVNPGEGTELLTKTVTLEAAMQMAVKSLVNDDGEFSWTSDDAIAVNVSYVDENDNDVNAFFKFDIIEVSKENDNVATFEGEIPRNGTVTGVAVYPYDEGHVYADGKLTVNFPTEVSETNHLPMMYAKIADGEAIQFKHLSSMLKLTYKYVPKGTDGMTFTSDGVAGLYNVDLETGALTATENVTNQVRVSFPALTQIQPEKSIYLPVPAGVRKIAANLTKGDETVKWSSISSKSARDYVAGHITLLPAANVHFPVLYIVGASEDLYSWSTSKMKAMEEVSDHVFTWTGNIAAGNRFRFPVDKVFYPAVYKVDGKPTMKYENMGNNYDFTVDKDGNYTVTVDATDMDNIKVNVMLNYRIYPDKYLFINGRATQKGAYSKDAEDWMWMTQVEPGVFEWEGQLFDDVGKDFKFLAKDGEWLPSYNKDLTAADEWTLVYRESNDEPDGKFEIENGDGVYRITANLNTMKVTCEFITPSLYITGLSVGGFTKTPSVDYRFSYLGNGLFTWTGNMSVNTGNGFKIINYGAYDPSWGPVGNATKVGKIGNGDMEWSNVDRKWDLRTEDGYAAGVYTIVLDTVNKKISLTLL